MKTLLRGMVCRAMVPLCILAVLLLVAPAIRDYRHTISFSRTSVGDFTVGSPGPFIPGEKIAHPYGRIPPSRFYVYVWEPGVPGQCVYEECGDGGEMVATLRGWLWGSNFDVFSLEQYHLPPITSLVIVADHDAAIVGIYPDARLSDVPDILKKHPDLADFSLLQGISRLGELAVGRQLPFVPTGGTREDPKFYFLIVHETTEKAPYCPYYECGIYIDAIGMLGGSFYSFDHDDPDFIEKLGLSPSHVARGEITVVVIADANRRVVSIHPNKDMRDVFAILKQHPDLADMTLLYPPATE